MLEEWLDKMNQLPDPKPKNEMVAVFREIRKLRQKPAHAVHGDVFEQKYFSGQRQLMIEVYKGMRTLRLMLESHPATQSCDIPDWLQAGKIWTY